METAVPTAFSGSLSSPGSSSPNQDSTSIHCVLHAHILPDAGHTMKSTGEKVLALKRGSHCCRHRHSVRVTEAGLEHGWSVMQTIPASVSVTIALINHPDMQCSGERI